MRFVNTRFFRYAIIVILSACVFIWGVYKPLYNWDLIPYSALALQKEGLSGDTLHRTTFQLVRDEVPGDVYVALTAGMYRSRMAQSSEMFLDMLPFYEQRKGYILMIWVLKSFGIPIVLSTILVSSLASALLSLLLGFYMLRAGISVWFLPFLISLAGITEVATLSTPDALVAFFYILLVVLVNGSLYWSALLAFLLPWFRLDATIFPILMFILLWISGNRKRAVVLMFSSICSFLFIWFSIPAYGPAITFHHTFEGPFTDPRAIPEYVSMQAWGRRFLLSIGDAANHVHAAIFVFGFYRFTRETNADSALSGRLFILLPLLFLVAHLCLFPAYFTRFFVGPAALVCLYLLKEWGRQVKEKVYQPAEGKNSEH